jgi:hypothetical protein
MPSLRRGQDWVEGEFNPILLKERDDIPPDRSARKRIRPLSGTLQYQNLKSPSQVRPRSVPGTTMAAPAIARTPSNRSQV